MSAVLTLIVGLVLFLIGVAGQAITRQRRARVSHEGDRHGARLVLTVAAIVIGAWMTIGSAVTLLHMHARAHQTTMKTTAT